MIKRKIILGIIIHTSGTYTYWVLVNGNGIQYRVINCLQSRNFQYSPKSRSGKFGCKLCNQWTLQSVVLSQTVLTSCAIRSASNLVSAMSAFGVMWLRDRHRLPFTGRSAPTTVKSSTTMLTGQSCRLCQILCHYTTANQQHSPPNLARFTKIS